MTAGAFFKKKFFAGAILVFGLAIAALITHAQTSPGSSSVGLKKDAGSGFFVLTIKASAGIKEFALYPPNKSPYGGGLSCPKTYKNELVAFADPDDFTPKMGATITDCNDNSVEFELPPPQGGLTNGKRVVPAQKSSAAAPAPASAETKAETKPEPKSSILTNVKFPVPELNNCQSETECVSYCDDVAHAKACLEFAKKNNILSADEIVRREKLVDISDGPGGCNSQKSCETYCSDISRLDECFSFAEKHSLLSEKELNKIGKIKAAVKAGVKLPGGCNNEKACESYCNAADHMDECLNFGEQSGFLDTDEIRQYRKFSELRQSGETPGHCSSKESCEAYCDGPDNVDECISFAEKAGFLSGDELEQVKKVLPLLKEGKTPGGCRNKQQCQSYCEDGTHADECIEFGLKAGIISSKDAEIMKKTGGKGPGGCHSKEQCEAYCQENQQACADWARENGLEGQFGGPDGGGPGGFTGPGGCKSQEECTAYCTANHEDEACKKMMQDFSGGGGFPGGGEGGAGDENAHDGFSECGISNGTVAEYVCATGGYSRGALTEQGVETTYFNECHARQQGAEVLHKGVCVRKGGPDVPCSDIAHLVCGTDGNSWTHECNAKEAGAGVKHEGVCTNEEMQKGGPPVRSPLPGTPGGPGGFTGPGGCKSQEECTAYCTAHPTECGYGPGGGGGTPVPPPAPAQSCAPLPSGLVSWLDDDTLSGASGGVTLAQGKVGKAMKFDGNGGYVKDLNPENLNFGTGPFSLEAWFNWDGGSSSKANIIRKSNYPVSGDGAGYWLAISKENSALEFFAGETVGNAGKPRGKVSAPISSGVWYFVVATRDASGTMSLYIDGQLKGTAQAPDANTTSEAPFTLGAWDDRFGLTELFSGLIDEVSVYKRALIPSEAQAIFTAGSAGKCAVQSQPQSSSVTPSGTQIPQDSCSGFASVPSCSYVGSPDSQNYKYCKQCFPDK